MNHEDLIYKIKTLENEKKILEEKLIELKKENLVLQCKNPEKIKIYTENVPENEGSHLFKNQENIKEDDTFFSDVLYQFYDLTVEQLDTARQGSNDYRKIYQEITNLYHEYRDYFSYYISDVRLSFIDKQIEEIYSNDSTFEEKIEEYYNKIYYEIIVEFLPLDHSFNPTN